MSASLATATQEALVRQAHDIRMLEDLLRQTIERLAGRTVLERFDSIREAATALRTHGSAANAHYLRDSLDSLDISSLRELIRAFSIYFDLNNLAEQHARIRAIRRRIRAQHPKPMAESVSEAVQQLRARGFLHPTSGSIWINCKLNPFSRLTQARPGV